MHTVLFHTIKAYNDGLSNFKNKAPLSNIKKSSLGALLIFMW